MTSFTEKLMTYALGRGLEPFDMPAIRKVVRAAGANDYKTSSLILEIVKSLPFQNRNRAAAEQTAANQSPDSTKVNR